MDFTNRLTGTTRSARAVRTRLLVLVAALATTLTAGACGAAGSVRSTATDTASPASATVTLGLYSGLADPTWTLTVSQFRELTSQVATLPRVQGTAPTGGLGYHGFTIEGPDGVLVAYEGAVLSVSDQADSYLSDPDRVIERFLLSTGQTQLTPKEYTEVRRALDG